MRKGELRIHGSCANAMAPRYPSPRDARLSAIAMMLILLGHPLSAAQGASEWQQHLREQICNQRLDAALVTVEQRIADSPGDLEAHGWRGRVLAWTGRWAEAENEYRQVLAKAPGDIDILIGLADVSLWQGKPSETLQYLDQAGHFSPTNPEVLTRRAKVLVILGRTEEARAQLRETLRVDPQNRAARKTLTALAPKARHVLRTGVDIDSYNYTDAAQSQFLSLDSRWNRRWSTLAAITSYQRFGETATKATGGATFRLTGRNWLSVGGAGANDHGVIPQAEAYFECGHGFTSETWFVRGLDIAYQQHWFWYRGAHVLTTGVSQLFYMPRDWTWLVTVNGARGGFSGSGVEWVPSGSTRLSFPLYRTLSGNLLFAVGSENFAQVDQIRRFSARTFGGGLRYRISTRHDVSGYVASQNRSQGRTQNSFGLSYGIRF
jgi:Tfp pilus assembly protein PilF